MSFLKIEDPKERDRIIQEYLQTKKNIQERNLEERVGKLEQQRELGEIFKPITETQQKQLEAAKETTEIIKRAIREDEPLALTYKQPLAITEADIESLGSVAAKYLKQYLTKGKGDLTYGVYREGSKYYIGNTEITFDGDDIILPDDRTIEGTPGLWDLLTSTNPSKKFDDYSVEDKQKYIYLMSVTGSMFRNNDTSEVYPKSSRSNKWKNYVSQVWDLYKYYKDEEEQEAAALGESEESEGSGLAKPPLSGLPVDLNSLIKRFDLLMASKAAGNSGVDNEIKQILDILLANKVITEKDYDNFFH